MSVKINTVVIFFDKKNSEFYITKSVLDNLNLSTNNTIFKDGVVYCRIDPNIIIFMRENENTNKFPYRLGYKRIDVEKSVRINNNQSSSNTSNRGQGQVDSQRRGKKELVFFYNQYEDYYFTTLDVLDAAKILPVSKFEYKGVEYYKVIKSYVDMLERFSNDSNNQFKIVIKTVSPKINISGNSNNRNQNSSNSNSNNTQNNSSVEKSGEVSNIMKQVRINIGQDNSVTTKYNYGQYQGRVDAFLSRIYRNSKDWFENPSNLDSLANLVRLVGFLDLYLHYYYEVHRDKFDYVFEAISGKCRGDIYEVSGIHGDYDLNYEYDDVKKKKIRKKGLLGDAHASGCFIDMNTTLSDEMLLLYLAHELGHVVNRRSLAGIDVFSDKLNNSFSINNPVTCLNEIVKGKTGTIKLGSKKNLTYNNEALTDGVGLLDEAITQDRAEDIAAYYTGRMRRKASEHSTSFYDGKTYKSNFDYYGEFEEPTVLFGSVIDEVGAIDDFEEAMRRISTMALSSELSDRVIDSFKNNEENLLKLLFNMGIIKGKKYSSIGVDTGCPKAIINSKSAIEAREDIARIVKKINGYGNSSGFRF